MYLILATNNQNKLCEIRDIFNGTEWNVLSQKEAGIVLDVEETGATFAENAALKAKAIWDAAQQNGMSYYVLADDSGLAVDALNGGPGVYSHRYAGENATDDDRIAKLLKELADTPDGKRGAHYACVMCLMDPNGQMHLCEGRVNGEILRECRGDHGFGYDPVFCYEGRSFAELSFEEKNAISHRRRALDQIVTLLKDIAVKSEGE